MPSHAPAIKISGAKSRGGEVILYDREHDDREAIAKNIVDRRGLVLVPPFDDPFVMAGQGTGATEAVEQLAADFAVTEIDQAIICCSGGGLAAGWSTGLRPSYPKVKIITAEPSGFEDMSHSLSTGKWETNTERSGTICDALQASTPGKLALPILMKHNAEGVSATDNEVRDAMRFAAQEMKLLLEPSGAVPLAVMLANKVDGKGRSTLIIASGGNVDPAVFIRAFHSET
jgi:threonine dehydratase